MNQVMALLIQTGGQLLSEHLRNRVTERRMTAEQSIAAFLQRSDERMRPYVESRTPSLDIIPEYRVIPQADTLPPVTTIVPAGKAEAIATGCIPCSLGHFTTCQGVLNESVRFAHEGLDSPEVVDRVMACLGELNALERLDLTPEMIVQLDGPEKDMAARALQVSRQTRHQLEGMQSVDDLIDAAAGVQTNQKLIARDWFKHKLQHLTPTDEAEISRRIEAKLNELAEVNRLGLPEGGAEEVEYNRELVMEEA